MLDKAHKGYEYQDLLTAVFMIEELLKDSSATFIIDRKEDADDKFDDISIITQNKTIKRQVKYSDNKVLSKSDLSSAQCDLALDTLFKSWKQSKNINNDLILCLAWEYNEEDDELNFLIEKSCDSIYGNSDVKFFKIDIGKIWAKGDKPINSWRRLRSASNVIDRTEFALFLDNLLIEVNLPKSSHDLFAPGDLEKIAIAKLRKLGIGKYPNNTLIIEDTLAKLLLIVKSARAKGLQVKLDEITYKIGLNKSFGNIEQNFSIDENVNVVNEDKFNNYYINLEENKKSILLGAPGSGKSWFVQNLINFFESKNIEYIRHYCYTGIGDTFEKERITVNVFLANLMHDILTRFPDLTDEKDTKYGVDINELQKVINCINRETVLIIDGLDHIGRIYSLHQDIMQKADTEIINIISELQIPENVKVILVSQPIDEVIKFKHHGFVINEIKEWSLEETHELMKFYGVEDVNLRFQNNISDVLLNRSDGNPLYLTYILRELSKYENQMITIELVDSFPAYDNDLSKYYSYLMEQIPEEHKVPQVLAGAPFYLNEQELGEITGLGKYIQNIINKIGSVLEFNKSSGGYIIYHESFRRYIIDLLKNNGVDVTKAIYNDLIEWLKNKDFYIERKSYLNLFQLLFECKKYDDILEYCNKEFIVDSLIYGQNIRYIKRNYELLMKSACKKKSYSKVMICTEICNMIHGLEDSLEENVELYYKCIGKINGFDKLNNLTIFEGQMCLPLFTGLRVCYICSIHNIIPNWKPYIDVVINMSEDEYNNLSTEEHLELYKYYICAKIDLSRDMNETLIDITEESYADERQIVIQEFARRDSMEQLLALLESIESNDIWKKDIDALKNDKTKDVELLDKMFEILKNVDIHSDDTYNAIKNYFNNIKWIVENKLLELKVFTIEISNRNWFYNWLIFIADVNTAIVNCNKDDDFEEKLIKAYEILILDTNVFKGEPRTCDLFRYENIIYYSIIEPMKHIKNKEGWNEVLNIIHSMSRDTMTSLNGSTCGPLTTENLFSMFLDIADEKNIDIIAKLMGERTIQEKNNRYYSYLADYTFKLAYALSCANKIDAAKDSLKQGVIYLLSYTSRKDRTLSRLIDSVDVIISNDKYNGINNILKLKTLSEAVVNHTDGSSTKRYELEWFKVLVKHDISIALAYLIDILPRYECYWIIEECLEEMLIELNGGINPDIEVVLYKTLPNCKDENFIASYKNVIEKLFSKRNEIQAIRSLKELICRFDIEEKDKITNSTLLESIKMLANTKNIDWNYDEYLDRSLTENNEHKYVDVDKNLNDKVCRVSFDMFTYDEILSYISKNGIESYEYQSLFYYLQSIENLDEQSMRFLSGLVKIFMEDSYSRQCKDRFIELVEELLLPKELSSYLYMQIFLRYYDGWYKRFTRRDLFSKSYFYSKEISEDTFFTYICNNMSMVNYSYAVGDQIIQCLNDIQYDQKVLEEYWNQIYDIINFRLPDQNEYNWELVIAKTSEWDNDEKLFAILLSRLKFGEASRIKWILSDLSYLLTDREIKKKFVKPLIWFLSDRNNYTDYAVYIILHIVINYYDSKEIIEYDIKKFLDSIYPTERIVTDFYIRKILNRNKKRIFIKYNHEIKSDRTDYLVKIMKGIDFRIQEFEEYGLDMGNAIKKYFKYIKSKDILDRYQYLIYDKSYNVLIPNVYFYDILTKCMAEEIEKFLSSFVGQPYINDLEEELYEILIDDIPLIIGINNSLNLRPERLLLPDVIEEGKYNIEYNEWVKIGAYEKFYNKRQRFYGKYKESTNYILAISGVVFDENLHTEPHLHIGEGYRLYSKNLSFPYTKEYLKGIKKIIVSDLSIGDNAFSTYKIHEFINLRNDILYCLGISIKENENGIVGVTKNGDIVLKYSRWVKNFGDLNTESYSIPYVLGAQLEMRSDIFEKMCNMIGKTPYYYINKYTIED